MSEQSPVENVSFETVQANGITLRLARAGNNGPLVLLAHGWPESWFSWRHQIAALVQAGYRVIAPDMRGYGGSEAPDAVEAYDIEQLSADLAGILDAVEEDKAFLVGHDWGAIVAWQTVLRYPDRFPALVNMSVPYIGRSRRSPMEIWQQKFGENFFYILYHNEAGGIAEREYDQRPYDLLYRLYQSPGAERKAAKIQDRKRSAGGWIDRLGEPLALPDWLSQKELDYFVGQFSEAGFRGGINYYRNFHRNWELANAYQEQTITVPTLFIAGAQDNVILGASAQELRAGMEPVITNLRGVHLIAGRGHWIQQEAAPEVNSLMLEFFAGLNP